MIPRIMCHRHTVTDEEQDLILKKINRLARFFDRITEVSVILDEEGPNAMAEILLSGPHINLRFAEQDKDTRLAFEAALKKAERGLQKAKERKWGDKMHRRHNLSIRRWNVEDFVGALETPEKRATPEVPVEHVELKRMALDAAYAQMMADSQEFVVFVNPDTEEINILHRDSGNEVKLMELSETRALHVAE